MRRPASRTRLVTAARTEDGMARGFGALQVLVATLLLAAAAAAQAPVFHYERSSGLETPRLAQTLEDARALAKASPWVRLTTFGRSPQGRELPLVVIDKERAFDPAAARARGKAVVMIQAGIHPGEPEGKDAGLLFLRDLLQTESPLLDRLVFVFIPVFNVDGHERFSAWTRINQNGP
jgi:murein tripeptide amidase MpaA